MPHNWRLCRFCQQHVKDEVEGFFILHDLLSSGHVCASFGQYVSEVFAWSDEEVMTRVIL